MHGNSGTVLHVVVELFFLWLFLVCWFPFKSYLFPPLNVSQVQQLQQYWICIATHSLPITVTFSASTERTFLSTFFLPVLFLKMSSIVASASLPSDDASALARKRRREILLSQRAFVPDLTMSIMDDSSSDDDDNNCHKRPRLMGLGMGSMGGGSSSTGSSSTGPSSSASTQSSSNGSASGKKPQMKYDPDVPMTREDAAVWRREQRRKRNRESAAASRQRQRDRIAELELEVDGFKAQYEKAMRKVQAMEELTNMTDDLIDSLPTVSPISSITFAGKDSNLDMDATVVSDSESEKEDHQYKMISRPA